MKCLKWALALVPIAILAAADVAASLAFGQTTGKPVSLAALAPADVGMCLEIRDLSRHAGEFKRGELYRRLTAFPPLKRWASDNAAGLAKVIDEIQNRLGVSPPEIWNGLLGRQVLLAVWPPERPGVEGPALLLLEASDPALLGRVVDRLVAAQREAGKWKSTRTLPAGGQTLTVHVLEAGQPGAELLLTTMGAVGMATTSEPLLRRVVQQASEADAAESLSALPAYMAGMSRLEPQASVRAFVSPRRWDQLLLAESMKKPPVDRSPEQQAFLGVWQATEYAVFSVDFGPQIAFEGHLQWQASALPEGVSEVVAGIGGVGDFWRRVPSGALVALVGRLDPGRLLRRFSQPAADAPSRAALTLAKGLGPDYAIYVTPRAADDADPVADGRLAADLVVGVDTRPLDAGDSQTPLSEVAGSLLQSALTVAAATANAESPGGASVTTQLVDEVTVTSLSGALVGAGPWAVSYAVAGRQFWLGTSPAAVARAAAPESSLSLAAREDVSSALARVSGPTDVLYIDLGGLRRLAQGWTTAVDDLAALRRLDRAVVERSWRELTSFLNLADTLLAAVRIDDRGVSVAVRVDAAQP